jgi:hypothetical protein
MDSRALGLIIVVLGLAAIVIGAVVYAGGLGWFGRLPGDLRVTRGTTRIFFPVTSLILLSIGLSVLLSLVRRFL